MMDGSKSGRASCDVDLIFKGDAHHLFDRRNALFQFFEAALRGMGMPFWIASRLISSALPPRALCHVGLGSAS